jgi:AcrR family transcriptional regulator
MPNTGELSATRKRILDAALDIFSSKGYHDTRLDEIVDQASVSKGSIYFHFPNKEQLFLALVDQFADLIERRVNEAIQDEQHGIRRVRAAIETVLETFGKYRRPAKLLLVQAVGLGSPFEKKRQQINERFADLIQTYLDEAVAKGDIPSIDTQVAAHAWMGAIYGLVIQWVLTGDPSKDRIMKSLPPLLLRSVGYDTHADSRA